MLFTALFFYGDDFMIKTSPLLKAVAAAAAMIMLTSCGNANLPLEASYETLANPESYSAPAEDTLRVMTFNTHNCEEGEKIAEVGKDIMANSPDVVCLQELDRGAKRSDKKDILAELAKETEMPYYCFFPAINYQGGQYGVGILSRYPLSGITRTTLDSGEEEGRVLGSAVINAAGKEINIYVTHLSFESTELRSGQFRFINNILKDKKPFILCGDFNIESYDEYSAIEGAQSLNSAENPIDSYKGENSVFKGIDNIFVSDDLTVTACKSMETATSDHNLIFADIALN